MTVRMMNCSVDSLSLIDLGADVAHSKVVSLDENTNKMSSFDLTVSRDENLNPLSPLGSIKTNIAELQLVILTPFVLQIVVRRLKVSLHSPCPLIIHYNCSILNQIYSLMHHKRELIIHSLCWLRIEKVIAVIVNDQGER